MASRRRRRAGFSMVELMMALFAGTLVMGGVYFVGGMSARHFGEQVRISEAQLSTRMALEQIRRDLGRAGFMSTRSSLQLTGGCTPSSPTNFQAVQVVPNDGDALLNVVENNTRGDTLRLTGNYATRERYLADRHLNAGMTIALQHEREAFRRSFYTPPATCTGTPATFDTADFDATLFASAFTAGRYVRIEDVVKSITVFREIASVDTTDPADPQINLVTAIPNCLISGNGNGLIIAPIERIQYAAENFAETPEGAALIHNAPSGAGVGAERSMLVRSELLFSADTEIAGSERPVLDYLVEFQVHLIHDVEPLAEPPNPPDFQLAATAAQVTNVSTNTPEQIRGIILTVSTRAAEQNPTRNFVARTNLLTEPLKTFIPEAPEDGVARVRTTRIEVALTNLLYRS